MRKPVTRSYQHQNESEIEWACRKQNFDVVVIGQSNPPQVKVCAVELVRQYCPAARILELYPPYANRTLKEADGWLQMPADPEELINAVNSLVLGKEQLGVKRRNP